VGTAIRKRVFLLCPDRGLIFMPRRVPINKADLKGGVRVRHFVCSSVYMCSELFICQVDVSRVDTSIAEPDTSSHGYNLSVGIQ
jgi:hypothetical protein